MLVKLSAIIGLIVIAYIVLAPNERHQIGAADGVVGGIWFDNPMADSKGNYPCIDVRLTMSDGGHKDLIAASVKDRKDEYNLCMGHDRDAQWVYENGQKQTFKPVHKKLVKERGRFY